MSEENAVSVIEPRQTEIVPADMPIMDKLLMAASNGMDIATLEKFMDLAERSSAIEAKKAYDQAFAEFKKDPPKIVKDALVDYKKKDGNRTRYTHVSLGNLTWGIIGGMAKQGLSHNWTLAQSGNNIRVTCVVTHSMGHSESTFLEAQADTSGGKNAIQGIGSTVKYLQRYTLEAISGISVFEKDDDGAGHKPPVIDAAYWCNKLDREAPKNLGGIKTWKAKNIKAINKMPEGQEKADTLAYIDDMIKEYAPAKQTNNDEKPVDRTMIDKCFKYLNSVSASLDEFMSGWNEHIKNNLKGLPADQQKELTDLKAAIETKFQGK